MRVAVYPADDEGCGWHRLRWPAEALARAGHDVVSVPPGERRLALALDARGNVRDVTGLPPGTDVVVLQRVTHRALAAAVTALRGLGIAVVIDVDDDLSSVDPRNPAFAVLRPGGAGPPGWRPAPGEEGGWPHSWEHLRDACRAATLVTVSTPALAQRYGRHGRVRVLENRLAAHYYEVDASSAPHRRGPYEVHRPAGAGGAGEDREALVLGWPATLRSHPGDLDVAAPAPRVILEEGVGGRPVRLRTATLAPGVARALGWPAQREAELLRPAAPVPLRDWPRFVAACDVGLAPLAATRFNQGKSWLKILEMSAVGVPWVASPVAEYRRLHREGAGLLADGPRAWRGALRALLTSADRRRELAEAGRAVADQHRLEDHRWRWWEAWDDAWAIQRGARVEVSA